VLFIAETQETENAHAGNALAGIAGISRDPYQAASDVGRLRHVYVDDRPYRSRGIATITT
jgi:hypothetical protein